MTVIVQLVVVSLVGIGVQIILERGQGAPESVNDTMAPDLQLATLELTTSNGRLALEVFALRDSFDHTFADPFSAKKSHGPRIVFALDDGQPGNTVIEHGCGCTKRNPQSYVD